MRKIQKRKALELTGTLHEMHMEIQKRLQRKETELVLALMAQCQEGALHLGNFIEEAEGEGFITVGYIESYCELVYQFYKELELCKSVNANKIYKALRRELLKIENSIKNDAAEHLEMVFLPYKSSMWDSLESVWRAADEDPECDAYVVPIPYFERNAQVELAAGHYEGNQFPEYVPVIDYRNFSLSERRPDVVFIHNPYDQYNYVTSIHPDYYIPELKKYAEKVVYIPYYISPEAAPESPEVQKQKEGFVMTSGVLQSDMVFLQSENMKRLYINILEKNFPDVKRSYWEGKIFGLGSPKLDRVYEIKRDDGRLSARRHSLIYDETGKRRKVILYNTSVSDLLNQENMMEKIADTLAFFEKNRECVLWWRPHPLYESTLASMRPNLLETYRKIVEDFKAKGYGIFDEGEDLEWAIAESDGYYGDGSSIVQLYLETGKPVLYQDTRVKNSLETQADIPVWPCAFCVDEEDVWFLHGKMNLLMKYHKKTEKAEILGSVPGEEFFREFLYGAIYKAEDKIYLIPCWAREIAVYDISAHSFTKIKLNGIEKYENNLLFCKCFAEDKSLYCMPFQYGAIVKTNLCTQEITYIDLKSCSENGGDIYIGNAVRTGNVIACIWNYSNQLLTFDLKSEKAETVVIGEKQEQYAQIGKIKDELVLYNKSSGDILLISLMTKRKKTIATIKNMEFSMSVVFEELIMIEEENSGQIICMDSDGKIRYKRENKEYRKRSALEYNYTHGIVAGGFGGGFYFDTLEYILYVFGRLEGIKEKYPFTPMRLVIHRTEEMEKSFRTLRQNENELLSLKEWVKWGTDRPESEKRSHNCGEAIERTVKKALD